MSSELKPCPFCFSEAEQDESGFTYCSNRRCPATAMDTCGSDSWNRRSVSPAVKALVEACRAFLGSLRPEDFAGRIGSNTHAIGTRAHEALAAVEREIGGQQ